jgi:cyclophilin family peptidyl-prolyl cis-trans isomerase
MAHRGRDTGGSQFFLVLEPQPHLDNNHTVFGQVVEGMDVMHALKQGDTIKSVKFAA